MIETSQIDLHSKRFIAYSNYCNHFSDYLLVKNHSMESIYHDVITSNKYKKIQRRTLLENDRKKLYKYLRNAWFTELLINKLGDDLNLIPYICHWLPVNVYYSIYLMMRSYLISCGQYTNNDHTATLATVANHIKTHPELFPRPWYVILEGDPGRKNIELTNVGKPISLLGKVSPLSSSANVKDLVGLFLKTTRKRELEKIISDWKKKQKRVRINRDERDILAAHLHPTTIFDFLYRMRLRSNYADADSFIVQSKNIEMTFNFYKSLREIAWHGISVFEILICRHNSNNYLLKCAENYISNCSDAKNNDLITKRLSFYKNLK